MTQAVSLTILFDNVPFDLRLRCHWGFSCLVETDGCRVLFDSGSNGRVLLRNMQALGIDPASLNDLVISHVHWDHIGGIDSLIELNPRLRVVVPASIPDRLVGELRALAGEVFLVGEEPVRLRRGIVSTGTIAGEVPEQALIIASGRGPLVITGCAHPGVAHIARLAAAQTGDPIQLLLGGYHLFESSDAEIENTIGELDQLGIRYLMPTHCSGEAATRRMAQRFRGRYLAGGAGRVLCFDNHGDRVSVE